ncbi:hypothetical protein A9Q84_12065 [Halobacteriovorax marinus]|uniref:tRNA-uridine aminocarboxypropyltransferase n=1 Tax=Halobacteriovorax marinus TaxID=97084 RepID=A0A1Y5FDV4_9BACT|nr:hypothetical protein A9Q84_12065 [Halobacteriovorax marinus]
MKITASKKYHFIFIDGTWKKAYKIFKLNSFLQTIPSITIRLEQLSPYSDIRKQKEFGLSSLEAICETLGTLENKKSLYEPLLLNFNEFIKKLKSFTH